MELNDVVGNIQAFQENRKTIADRQKYIYTIRRGIGRDITSERVVGVTYMLEEDRLRIARGEDSFAIYAWGPGCSLSYEPYEPYREAGEDGEQEAEAAVETVPDEKIIRMDDYRYGGPSLVLATDEAQYVYPLSYFELLIRGEKVDPIVPAALRVIVGEWLNFLRINI